MPEIVTFIESSDYNEISASRLIETVIPCLSEELFTLKKNYTVVNEVPYAVGKWPESLGNSFFCDSQYMVPDLVDMAQQRLQEILLENNRDPASAIETYVELSQLLMKRFKHSQQNDYALVVLGKMRNRDEEYLYGVTDALIY